LALVVVDVGRVHPPQILDEQVTGEQPSVLLVPVLVADEAVLALQLEAVGLLGRERHAVREIVGLLVDLLDALGQRVEQLVVGVARANERIDDLGVVNLLSRLASSALAISTCVNAATFWDSSCSISWPASVTCSAQSSSRRM